MINEKPITAFVLSLISGISILLVGFLAMIIRYSRLRMGENVRLIGGAAGLLGVVWGMSVVVGAVMLYFRPQQHKTWGIIVLVFAFLSWIGSFGGLIVGFVLGLIGGILGITWKPSAVQPTLTPPPSPATRICPNCSTVIYTGAEYCPKCGKELP